MSWLKNHVFRDLIAGVKAVLKAAALCGADSGSETDAQAAPGFGYDDAVTGVLGVVADLDGEVDADVADVLRETGYVLQAFVAYAGHFVLIAKDIGWGVFDARAGGFGVDAAVWTVEADVYQGGVGDATAGGEELAALALDLFRAGAAVVEDVSGNADGRDYAEGDRANLVGTEMQG